MWWIWIGAGLLTLLLVGNVVAHLVRRVRRARGRHSARNEFGMAPPVSRPSRWPAEPIPIRLPWGDVLQCRPLLLEEGWYFLKLYTTAKNHDDEAVRMAAKELLVEQFPAAVGAEDEFSQFMPEEFMEAVEAFLSHRRIRQKEAAEPHRRRRSASAGSEASPSTG